MRRQSYRLFWNFMCCRKYFIQYYNIVSYFRVAKSMRICTMTAKRLFRPVVCLTERGFRTWTWMTFRQFAGTPSSVTFSADWNWWSAVEASTHHCPWIKAASWHRCHSSYRVKQIWLLGDLPAALFFSFFYVFWRGKPLPFPSKGLSTVLISASGKDP